MPAVLTRTGDEHYLKSYFWIYQQSWLQMWTDTVHRNKCQC